VIIVFICWRKYAADIMAKHYDHKARSLYLLDRKHLAAYYSPSLSCLPRFLDSLVNESTKVERILKVGSIKEDIQPDESENTEQQTMEEQEVLDENDEQHAESIKEDIQPDESENTVQQTMEEQEVLDENEEQRAESIKEDTQPKPYNKKRKNKKRKNKDKSQAVAKLYAMQLEQKNPATEDEEERLKQTTFQGSIVLNDLMQIRRNTKKPKKKTKENWAIIVWTHIKN
jgi:hypothetical protein